LLKAGNHYLLFHFPHQINVNPHPSDFYMVKNVFNWKKGDEKKRMYCEINPSWAEGQTFFLSLLLKRKKKGC